MSAALDVGPHVDAAQVARLEVFREIGDLKRVTSAGRPGSIATRLFESGWSALAAGMASADVASAITAEALVATRLGDLDTACLWDLGLGPDDATRIRDEALDVFAPIIAPALLVHLRGGLRVGLACTEMVPAFVGRLADQDRAGVTCPGRRRIVLQPAENHAEHCVVVAVYGVLLAADYGADPTTVFLAAIAHHLHNAAMPDSGFTGEMLLGRHLPAIMERANERALAQLAPDLRKTVESARRILPDASSREGRAFHAADVLDRVLEIEQHLAAARLTMDDVLGEMELVHAGPVKHFHDGVLRQFGLL